MASHNQNYVNPRQQNPHMYMGGNTGYSPQNSMNNVHNNPQGLPNGYRTSPTPATPRLSGPLTNTNNLKTGPISHSQTPLNLSNPTGARPPTPVHNNPLNYQNGVHHNNMLPQGVTRNAQQYGNYQNPQQMAPQPTSGPPRPTTSAPLTQLGTPIFPGQTQAAQPQPNSLPTTRPTIPQVSQHERTNSLPQNVPNVPGSSAPLNTYNTNTAPPLPQGNQPPMMQQGNQPPALSSNISSQPSMPSVENSSAPAGKRRAYPQQPAPGIATSKSQNLVQPSLPNSNSQLQPSQATVQSAVNAMGKLAVEQTPTYPINLLEHKQVMTNQSKPLKPPASQDSRKKCVHPDIMRCTFNAIPQSSSLLKQSKLPFGIYIHPFKEDPNMPVVSSVITRCRSCRSYLNPFVSILDQRRWQCNMCFRINDIPEELTYDYDTRLYCDIRKRPELTAASIEFIAPQEYMLRPPQPSVYLFVLDVSFNAINTNYLEHTCKVLIDCIENLPGDSRTMIGFITFNSSVHFYSLKATQSQPQMFIVSDLEDLFLPALDGLLVNVKENKEMILELLETLPASVSKETDTGSATGAALASAKKMVASVGGRITLFQSCIPSVGPGKLAHREVSTMTASSKDSQNLNPATDYYKKLALECAGEQIAIDIFVLAGQYIDLASLSCASRYSSGSVYYFPEFHGTKNLPMTEKFRKDFERYLTRSIGLEAVMRLRCTKGMNIHTFHGNFFVRSTDLLSLPNVNPDHSFSMQIEIEDSLTETTMVAFQAALLYTTTKGERRIRVHTLSLPVTSKITDVYTYADQEAIVCALSKLAVDRTLMSSLGDAREALMNACIDFIKVYKNDVNDQRSSSNGLIAPYQLRLIPLLILALMKNSTFKLGSGVPLDMRVFSLLEFKWQPIIAMLLKIYPKVYSVLQLIDENGDESQPTVIQATAERLSRQGVYLMDTEKILYLFVGRNVPDEKIQLIFNVPNVAEIPEKDNTIPVLENPLNIALLKFIDELRSLRPLHAMLLIIREDTKDRLTFLNKLIDDRTESSMSYHEFLQHVQRQCVG